VASSSKVASRFAYDVLANADEAAKAPGVKRGKDGHVQLAAADDFFSAPLAPGGKASGGRYVRPCDLSTGRTAGVACDERKCMSVLNLQDVKVTGWLCIPEGSAMCDSSHRTRCHPGVL